MAKVIIPQEIADELRHIGDGIEAEAGRATAFSFVQKIRERCQSLDSLPTRGARYQEDYRRLFEPPYQIIYRIEGSGDGAVVYIVTVRHMARQSPEL